MKKVLFNTAFLLAGLLTLSMGFAQDKKERTEPRFKKTKTHSKSYSLSSSDKIRLNNQFGEMKLVTWEKNEIKVDVSITGKSDDEKRAQEIIDKISIADGKDGNTVYFKTKFADNDKDWDDDKDKHNKEGKREHHNEGMEINYLVYLPSGNALNAENQFGEMIIPDYRGEAEIESQFGSLTAGKISNAKSVTVEFGEATIAEINGGDLNIKFSSGTVNKLSGDVRSDLEFSTVKLVVDNSIKNLVINNSYSSVYLDMDKSFSASWDVQTSHGGFSNKTDFAIKEQGGDEKGYGPRFSRNYKGTSGSGAAKVRINSSFGEIIAGHNLQVDMTDKHDDKDKHKNKSKSKTTHI
ncbi:MAG: hypothetical protein HOP10_15925 [Chitinophagaceae bacterium]|nr:hypothetical protein [Chitinophagaceae bacterium]